MGTICNNFSPKLFILLGGKSMEKMIDDNVFSSFNGCAAIESIEKPREENKLHILDITPSSLSVII